MLLEGSGGTNMPVYEKNTKTIKVSNDFENFSLQKCIFGPLFAHKHKKIDIFLGKTFKKNWK